jgi:nitrogenase molybdenum-iron protein alpha/beta subunit
MARPSSNTHADTPTKARVKGALAMARFQKEHYGTPFFHRDICGAIGVNKRRGYRILKDVDRRFHNNPLTEETRGRKKILSEDDIDKIEKLIGENGIEGRKLSN